MPHTVLIADHDPHIRECCCRCLKAHGYDAVTAADGLQCLEQLQAESPEVLVLDPEILWGGGAGILAWLREQSPLKPVRVIVTNGHALETFPPHLERLISVRLQRPTSLHDLTEFVNRLQEHLASELSWNRHWTERTLAGSAAILRSR